jgi:hypothetical protein
MLDPPTIADPAMLEYAPVPSPVRVRSLAHGAGLATATTALALISTLLTEYLLVPHLRDTAIVRTVNIVMMLLTVAGNSAILGAVARFAHALPLRDAPTTRWPVIACFALAATKMPIDVINSITWAVHGELVLKPPYPSWALVVLDAGCLSRGCGLALTLAAAIYLAKVGSRLQYKTLGLAAALALTPSAILELHRLAGNTNLLVGVLTARSHWFPFLSIPTWVSIAVESWALLLWSSIALFALILARSRPQSLNAAPAQ